MGFIAYFKLIVTFSSDLIRFFHFIDKKKTAHVKDDALSKKLNKPLQKYTIYTSKMKSAKNKRDDKN